MGSRVNRLHTIWMDGGYRGENFMRWVMDVFRWIVEIVLRPLEKRGFVLLPKRWVVERTLGSCAAVIWNIDVIHPLVSRYCGGAG